MKLHVPTVTLLVIAAVLLSSSPVSGQGTGEDSLLHVRVLTSNPEALERKLVKDGYDVMGVASSSELDVVVTRTELKQLRRLGFTVRVVDRGRPLQEILQQ